MTDLAKQLERWLRHTDACISEPGYYPDKCTCGLAAALAEALSTPSGAQQEGVAECINVRCNACEAAESENQRLRKERDYFNEGHDSYQGEIRLRKAAESNLSAALETIASLRRDLADPPGDVQEAVLRKLGYPASQEKQNG